MDNLAVRPTKPVQWIYPFFANHLASLMARLVLPSHSVVRSTSFDDTVWLYMVLLGCGTLTVVITGVWSVLDRQRVEYRRLNRLFRILLRYSLAYVMLLYGMDKVIDVQFPGVELSRMVETYGNSSPMGLMYTFMGQSRLYVLFAGVAEVTGGLLVIFRRTALLGALICAAVMINVTLMDFLYDVPVKMLALHLLLMAIVVVVPDLDRLADVLVRNRAARPAMLGTAPTDLRWRMAYRMAKVLMLVYLTVPLTVRDLRNYHKRGMGANDAKPALYGLYAVDVFKRNGSLEPALLDDATRWRDVAVEVNGDLIVRHMDDSMTAYKQHYNAATHTATIDAKDSASSGELLAIKEADNRLRLSGTVDGAVMDVELRRLDPSKSVLMSRGFHWVNDKAFYR